MGALLKGPWKDPGHPNLPKDLLARELGKSPRTIDRYVKAGMPSEDGRFFNLQDVLSWLDQDERKAS